MRRPATRLRPAAFAATALVATACAQPATSYDPLARAASSVGRTANLEASIPPACYTATGGVSNPCWTCHTDALGPNTLADWTLQREYAFSDFARANRWRNLFVDRSAAADAIGDEEILRWIRHDNYWPLRAALAEREGYDGYRPDLDLRLGFDDEGFALDDSGWRAIRYKPFPGAFWPTNGSSDDVFVRLPLPFRVDEEGRPSREVYRANFDILEAAIGGDAGTPLPERYAGAAADVSVRRWLYPVGAELLHTVRYVDPDAPDLRSRRLKELRYMRKVADLDDWARLRAYEREQDEKDEGHPPVYAGSPGVGLRNDFGWQLQGFIEDERGRLRLQTEEEHRFCMGCHGGIGVTVDATFALARKVPGRDGWREQDLHGMPDAPQRGHRDPEVLEYFRRVGGGDELRANDELMTRFYPGGVLDEVDLRRAAPGGDLDLAELLAPSRRRALRLDKAYRVLVREQSFAAGRQPVLGPPTNVHDRIDEERTGLEAAGRIYRDGRLHLDWAGGGAAGGGS